MNISPFRKQIQKFFLFIVIILISFSIFPVLAQAQSGGPRGSTCTESAIISNSVYNFVKDRNKVQWEENFNVQIRLTFKQTPGALTVAKDCEASGKKSYQFVFYLYNGTSVVSTAFKPGKSVKANFFADKKNDGTTEYGYIAQQSVNIKALMGSTPIEPGSDIGNGIDAPDPATGYIYTYLLGSAESVATGPLTMIWTKAVVTGDPTQPLPPLPGGINADQETTPDPDTIAFDQLFFGVKIKSATNDPHRNFFRISSDGNIAVPDTANAGKNKVITFAAFDQNGGIPVTLSLAEGSAVNALKIGSSGTALTYRKIGSDYPTLAYFLGQSHRAYKVFLVNVEDKNQKNKDVCAVSVFSATQYSCDKAKIKEVDTGLTLLTKGDEVDMPIKLAAGKSLSSIGITGTAGTVVTLNVLPTVNTGSDWLQWVSQAATIYVTAPITFSNGFAPAGFSYGKEPVQKVHFQIYATKAELEAHKDDAVPSTVPAYADAVTGNTESSGQSAGKTLYDFIVSIILTIVVFLTSQIYEIFAYFVVPVLNALLKVRPYQDAFVNIIYPGWLILRNLANIFFIISLLVVGLRILFQQSAASTARGFIMRLIIMALLVNFSLVIGQGIVGIADTVQSQFLPKDSKVIEALGTKLMVDPVKSFRSAVTGSETGQIKGDPNIGDVTKPLVMLILAVAAFFSFIAIAAFLAVRLVALMILYMVSPVAYVGFVMDETKSYAKRWWNEFLKYAFVTPILVFFLNIAALVAVSTASNSGTVFQIGDGIADNLVEGGLTIISHFIVLLIIFAGMKFALSSGHAGAGTIVKYVQKGFENTFKKPAQLAGKAAIPAKDFLGDKAAVGAGKLFGNRAENIVQSLFKPKDALGKLKKGAWDKPGEDRKKREAKRLQTIEDQSYKIMNNKWKATKYAASTLAGNGPKRAFAEGGALIDESQILTDEDRRKFVTKLDEQKDLAKQKIEEKELLDGGKMTVAKADSMTAGMDRDMLKLQNEQRELEKQRKKYAADNNQLGVDTADKDIQDVKDRLTAIQEAKKGIEDAKITATDGVFEFKNLQALEGFNVVFKPDEYKATLDKQAKDAETEKSRIERQLEEDDRRRNAYGYGDAKDPNHKKMTEPVRVQLYEAGAKAQEAATKRFLPESLSSREARRAAEREEDKKLEDVDDPEELTENFATAMKKNNIALATAIAKKLAKEGNFDKLLAKQGYENNVESYQAFMDKNFKNMVPQIRFQIASEVSHLASQNGNTTFMKPTKVKDGVMRWSRIEEHQEARNPKIKNASSADLAKKKKWEIFTQRNGQEELASATLQAFNNMDKKKLQEYVKRKSPEELATIAKAANYKDLNPNVRREFENRVI